MLHRIEIHSKIDDARVRVRQEKLNGFGFDAELLELVDVYTLNKPFSEVELDVIGGLLTNPITEEYITNFKKIYAPDFDWAVEIGFLPGVTDNVASTAKETTEDRFRTKFQQGEGIYTSQTMYLRGGLSRDEVEKIAGNFANPLINRIYVKDREEFVKSGGMDIVVPRMKISGGNLADLVNLEISGDELVKLGKEGIPDYDADGKEIGRRGRLALDLASIKIIRNYFRKKGRNPTDIEIESIAQSWSEHCKHTIFAAEIDELTEGLYKTYIKGATEKIRAIKGKDDCCVSVFTDNAGAIVFDENYLVCFKVETHNSPSALDPFGGAITGIVGVNRDIIGFGLGAKPVINTYGFCFGYPEDKERLYRGKNKSNRMLSPKTILEGVIEGVKVGGNCSGIPTNQGFILFDERHKGKPLVFVGTAGIIPKEINGKPSHIKQAQPGDYIVMVGGRVGLDGIHGATFSSESLSSGSPSTAVQIGDPITQKKLSDAIIKEARDLGLYNSITDNGAGGLSCSVAEMAKESKGCYVNLDKIPLKYPGMAPWQIWISESQERMTLAVPPEKIDDFINLMNRRGVEATVIGEFTNSGKCVVDYGKENVMNVELDFLHDGLPKKKLTTTVTKKVYDEPKLSGLDNLTEHLLEMMGRHNICSKEFISVQYDHEVQGGSVLKPLAGKGRVNSSATVTRPLPDSYKGIALSQSLFPSYGDIDTYNMATCAIDEAVRNIIAVGGNIENLALLDNFCWCSSNEPERLGQLKRAAKACYDTAVAYKTPFISGKDSMFNDFQGFDENNNPVKISIPPTLLISSIGVIDDVRKCVSPDFKHEEDIIYVLGETKDELGGSEFYAMLGEKLRGEKFIGNNVPNVEAEKNIPLYTALTKAIDKGLVASASSIVVGGLAACLAKSSIAGDLGIEVNVSQLAELSSLQPYSALFSESTGRFVVSIASENTEQFERMLEGSTVYKIGKVAGREFSIKCNEKTIIKTEVPALENIYKKRFGKN